ncbi:MAG: hypothetical protein HYV07_16125 [Deltaproteobacteria bacterium]|nr:hypothetical protein [Deltaproteobacteria bacterium]
MRAILRKHGWGLIDGPARDTVALVIVAFTFSLVDAVVRLGGEPDDVRWLGILWACLAMCVILLAPLAGVNAWPQASAKFVEFLPLRSRDVFRATTLHTLGPTLAIFVAGSWPRLIPHPGDTEVGWVAFVVGGLALIVALHGLGSLVRQLTRPAPIAVPLVTTLGLAWLLSAGFGFVVYNSWSLSPPLFEVGLWILGSGAVLQLAAEQLASLSLDRPRRRAVGGALALGASSLVIAALVSLGYRWSRFDLMRIDSAEVTALSGRRAMLELHDRQSSTHTFLVDVEQSVCARLGRGLELVGDRGGDALFVAAFGPDDLFRAPSFILSKPGAPERRIRPETAWEDGRTWTALLPGDRFAVGSLRMGPDGQPVSSLVIVDGAGRALGTLEQPAGYDLATGVVDGALVAADDDDPLSFLSWDGRADRPQVKGRVLMVSTDRSRSLQWVGDHVELVFLDRPESHSVISAADLQGVPPALAEGPFRSRPPLVEQFPKEPARAARVPGIFVDDGFERGVWIRVRAVGPSLRTSIQSIDLGGGGLRELVSEDELPATPSFESGSTPVSGLGFTADGRGFLYSVEGGRLMLLDVAVSRSAELASSAESWRFSPSRRRVLTGGGQAFTGAQSSPGSAPHLVLHQASGATKLAEGAAADFLDEDRVLVMDSSGLRIIDTANGSGRALCPELAAGSRSSE